MCIFKPLDAYIHCCSRNITEDCQVGACAQYD
jgi:hypothetical protein